MKNVINLKQLALAIALTGFVSSTSNAASINGQADATVIEPLSITEDVSMDFGTIAATPIAGTVVLDVAGTRTATDVDLIPGGTEAAGEFTVDGEPDQGISVSITGPATLDDGGGITMTVNGFNHNSSPTLDPTGTTTFQVGATLNVGANQAAGTYSTTGGTPYTITVNYN